MRDPRRSWYRRLRRRLASIRYWGQWVTFEINDRVVEEYRYGLMTKWWKSTATDSEQEGRETGR